jgi:ubiquinone biosynthesis protein UbiJ
MLLPREFFSGRDSKLSLKCEISRYGRRLANAFADRQRQADMEKFVQAVEQLAEEVERVERRLALMEHVT